jgi:hypothetical protein
MNKYTKTPLLPMPPSKTTLGTQLHAISCHNLHPTKTSLTHLFAKLAALMLLVNCSDCGVSLAAVTLMEKISQRIAGS